MADFIYECRQACPNHCFTDRPHQRWSWEYPLPERWLSLEQCRRVDGGGPVGRWDHGYGRARHRSRIDSSTSSRRRRRAVLSRGPASRAHRPGHREGRRPGTTRSATRSEAQTSSSAPTCGPVTPGCRTRLPENSLGTTHPENVWWASSRSKGSRSSNQVFTGVRW